MKYLKLAIAASFALFSVQAQALIIDANCSSNTYNYTDPTGTDDCWTGTDSSNLGSAGVSNIVGTTVTELYKRDYDDGIESFSFADDYSTAWKLENTEPTGATIKNDGTDSISCPECFLYVKDGKNDPAYYIFDIGFWNGTDSIDLSGFWDGDGVQGSISHVSIFGNAANVPEPSIIALLGAGLIAIGLVRRRNALRS